MNFWHKKTVLPSLAARSEMLAAMLVRREIGALVPTSTGAIETEDTSDTALFEDD
jgi:hypothetical protein